MSREMCKQVSGDFGIGLAGCDANVEQEDTQWRNTKILNGMICHIYSLEMVLDWHASDLICVWAYFFRASRQAHPFERRLRQSPILPSRCQALRIVLAGYLAGIARNASGATSEARSAALSVSRGGAAAA
jgi:hypothetical protein